MGSYHDIFEYPQEELRRKTPTELDALFRDQVRRTQRGETIDQSTQRRQLIMPQDLDFPGELRPATPMTMQPKNSVPSLKQELDSLSYGEDLGNKGMTYPDPRVQILQEMMRKQGQNVPNYPTEVIGRQGQTRPMTLEDEADMGEDLWKGEQLRPTADPKGKLRGPPLPFVDKQGEASTQRSRGYKPQSEYVEGKEEMTPDMKGPFSGMLSPDLEILRDSPTTERIKQFQMLHGADHVPKEFDESLDDPNDSGDELTVKRRGRSSGF